MSLTIPAHVPVHNIVVTSPDDHTTAWLAFVGAILVALVAAGTAQWRLRVQLDREDQRKRQELAHQRAMTDRDELRTIVLAIITAVDRFAWVATGEFEDLGGKWNADIAALKLRLPPDDALLEATSALMATTSLLIDARLAGDERAVEAAVRAQVPPTDRMWRAAQARLGSRLDDDAADGVSQQSDRPASKLKRQAN